MVLLVIGNGSDITLGYPTTLSDCNHYLKYESKKSAVIRKPLKRVLYHYKNSKLFCGEFWKDVENNIPKVSKPPKGVSGEEWYGTNLWQDIHDLFQYWVVHVCRYIKMHNINPKNKKEYLLLRSLINQSDLIFNFNYTKTLEDHFHVNRNRIIHIHRDSEYPILGHGEKDKISKENDTEQYKYYCVFVDGTTKDTIGQFSGCKKKFINAHISKIIFFGVSYSRIDWPYFKYIKNTHDAIQSDCQCILYYHSLKDIQSVKNFRNYLYRNKIICDLKNANLLLDH